MIYLILIADIEGFFSITLLSINDNNYNQLFLLKSGINQTIVYTSSYANNDKNIIEFAQPTDMTDIVINTIGTSTYNLTIFSQDIIVYKKMHNTAVVSLTLQTYDNYRIYADADGYFRARQIDVDLSNTSPATINLNLIAKPIIDYHTDIVDDKLVFSAIDSNGDIIDISNYSINSNDGIYSYSTTTLLLLTANPSIDGIDKNINTRLSLDNNDKVVFIYY